MICCIGAVLKCLYSYDPIAGKAEKARSAEAIPVEMPPELCLVLGISTAIVRSAYLIPSVMHRLKSALTASHLRHTIQEAIPSTLAIPIARVRF